MKKVAVLLSTYNGEKYVEEQLESILGQTYPDIQIYVRDDGSSDNTVSILEKYEKSGKITFMKGKNVGFIKSFFELVKACGDCDFAAYCDQDDIWLPEKISLAVEAMNKKDNKKPILYFSNYDFYDTNMNFQSHCPDKKVKPSFENALVDCISLGFNSVFNKAALKMMQENIPEKSCGHDWWTYMLCISMGEVIYDRHYTVKYRRHEDNVSAGGMKFIAFQIWRLKKFFFNDYFKNIRMQLKEFENLYGHLLKEQDRRLLSLFTRDKYNFIIALKKVFYQKRFRNGIFDEIALRIIFLIGKL